MERPASSLAIPASTLGLAPEAFFGSIGHDHPRNPPQFDAAETAIGPGGKAIPSKWVEKGQIAYTDTTQANLSCFMPMKTASY
jgi:hypothetical protein